MSSTKRILMCFGSPYFDKNVRPSASSSPFAFRSSSRSSRRFGYHILSGSSQKSAQPHALIQLWATSKTSSDEVFKDRGVRRKLFSFSRMVRGNNLGYKQGIVLVSLSKKIREYFFSKSKSRQYLVASSLSSSFFGSFCRRATIAIGLSSRRSMSCRKRFASTMHIEQSASLDFRSVVVVLWCSKVRSCVPAHISPCPPLSIPTQSLQSIMLREA